MKTRNRLRYLHRTFQCLLNRSQRSRNESKRTPPYDVVREIWWWNLGNGSRWNDLLGNTSRQLSNTKRDVAKAGPNRLVLEDGSRWNSRRCGRSRQPGNQQLMSDAYLAVCLLNNLVTCTTNDPDETYVNCGIFKTIWQTRFMYFSKLFDFGSVILERGSYMLCSVIF